MRKSDIYKLRDILWAIDANARQDVNNPMQGDKREKLIQEGVELCNHYIYKMQPLKAKSNE